MLPSIYVLTHTPPGVASLPGWHSAVCAAVSCVVFMTQSTKAPPTVENKFNLTEKQWKFVNFYAATGNLTQSAIQAGYSHRNKGNTARTLLKTNKSAAFALEHVKADIQEAVKITAKSICAELDAVKERALFADDFASAIRCIELKGKTVGAFIDRSQLNIGGSSEMDWQAFAQLGKPNSDDLKNITPKPDTSN